MVPYSDRRTQGIHCTPLPDDLFLMIDFSLVEPSDFQRRISQGDSESSWVLLEAHFSSFDHPLPADAPTQRHIPGAIQIHPSYLEAGTIQQNYYPNYHCPEDGNVLPPEKLIPALQRLGIGPDTEILVYGSEPDGIMAAARLIWGLMYAGVSKIRLLDGGLDAWVEGGMETVPKVPTAIDLAEASIETSFEEHWQVYSDFLATSEEVKNLSASQIGVPARLVDVRRPEEYSGTETKYYPFFSKAGHIPRAVLQGNWVNLVEPETHRVGPVLEKVRQRWKELGIVDEAVEKGETTLIFYCGTGWRSSLSFLVATLLGYRAKNFDDGFYGWSWTGENEVSYESSESQGELISSSP